MRKLILLISILFIAINSFTQNLVTGKVTDEQTGLPVAGASVIVKGEKKGVVSDAEGNFSISASSAKSLVVSFVGYADKEVPITSSTLNVALTQSSKSLSEVVVVGYGTKIRKDITGSVAQVNAKQITNTPATSFETAIQGRAAGVFVAQQNGKLGQAINVTIRGGSSVTGGNQPLYVVDGIPVTAADLSGNGSSTNSLSDINMNDIASIEILKDASSAAIYGSRASNGVVLITTKKGKAGTSKIEFNYFTGTQEPTGKREFLNSKQYVDFLTQSAIGAATQDVIYGYYPNINKATKEELSYVNSRFTRYAAGDENSWKNAKINTNWQNEAFQHAPISQYDLNVSGGNEKTKVFLSGQYLDQTGIIIANEFKRYSARLNIEQQVKDWLSVGMNMNFSRSKNNRLSDDDQFSSPLQIVALSPITPVIDPRTGLISGALDPETGAPNTNYPVYFNPLLAYGNNAYYHTLVNRTFGDVYINATILPELIFRSEFGMDQLNQTEDSYFGRLTARDIGVPDGSGSYGTTQALHYTTNNYFNYKKTFADVHDLDITAGMSYEDESYDFSEADAEEFPSDAYRKLAAGASKTGATSSSTTATLVSYFARLNYKFNDKYLVALSDRIDGSSRFGKKYGSFPAASVGWVLSEEKFLENNKFFNFLKLKAGYGLTGNNEIADFASRGLYTYAAYGGQAGQVPSQLGNPDLTWETTVGTDIGFELSILNSRIDIDFDYYVRKTKDLLLEVQVPGTSGFSEQLQNVGNLYNKGFEIEINSTNISTKNLRWTSSFNFSRNKNKVTNLGGQVLGTDVNKAMEGQPLGVFFVREFAGADPANGDALYYKNTSNADGTKDHSTTNDYNAATDVVIGDPNPDFIYGLGNTVTYKNFDLDILLQGVYGNQIYNGGGQYMSSSASNGFDNQTPDQLAAWKKPGDITMIPEARLFYPNGTDPSSRYISDGSYMRVKAVSLGYNLPKDLLTRWKVDHLRVYVRAENLFTFTKYEGWDPEVSADFYNDNINRGQDFYSAPQFKTITVGVNIGL